MSKKIKMRDVTPPSPARDVATSNGRRTLAEEIAVALTYQGSTHAVMMASPTDLEEFAIGFSLSEGFITKTTDIESLEILPHPHGIEARLWLTAPRAAAMAARRRKMIGPVGCGLCGIDSLDAALRPLPNRSATAFMVSDRALLRAALALRDMQPLQDATRAVHAAAFIAPEGQILCLREDVGRHNALDKLIGALLGAGTDPASGAIMMTSRLSVDMIQKTAMAGTPVLCAVSAPTALAVEQAARAGITLACLAGPEKNRLDVFSCAHRIITKAPDED